MGVDIAGGKFAADVAVVSSPSLHANATYEATYSAEEGFQSGNDKCKGVQLGFNLQHSLYAQGRLKFGGKEKTSNKTKILDDFLYTIKSVWFRF